jgi:hypothetical protein
LASFLSASSASADASVTSQRRRRGRFVEQLRDVEAARVPKAVDCGEPVEHRVPSVSREQRLISYLRARPTSPTRTAVVTHLQQWMTPEQAEATIERALVRSDAIQVAPGGRLVYWNTEQGSGIGLYTTVARVITRQWGRKELGLRHVEIARPPHGRTATDDHLHAANSVNRSAGNRCCSST